jgi:hypothetical protein
MQTIYAEPVSLCEQETQYMSESLFWQIIERSCSGSVDCFDQCRKLTVLLEALSPEQISAFDTEFRSKLAEAYRWDLWGAAYLVMGGCSDDGFEVFRAWLIGQGQDAYTDVVSDPETLLDYLPEEGDLDGEMLLYCAAEAYAQKTGQTLPPPEIEPAQTPEGEPWDEDDLREMFPALWEFQRG